MSADRARRMQMEKNERKKKMPPDSKVTKYKNPRNFPGAETCWPWRGTEQQSPAGFCLQRHTRRTSESLGFPSLILFALGAWGVYILNHSLQTNQQYLPRSVKGKQPQFSCFKRKSKNFPVGIRGLERLVVSWENNSQWNSELGQWGDSDFEILSNSLGLSVDLKGSTWGGFKSQTWKPPISILIFSNGNGRREEREHLWEWKWELMTNHRSPKCKEWGHDYTHCDLAWIKHPAVTIHRMRAKFLNRRGRCYRFSYVPSKNTRWNSNSLFLRMWLYLETESLQM